nr:immunoglobulin heavy chain junction region [Mus musculus]
CARGYYGSSYDYW